jgi:hypothetical protein
MAKLNSKLQVGVAQCTGGLAWREDLKASSGNGYGAGGKDIPFASKLRMGKWRKERPILFSLWVGMGDLSS